MMDYVLFSTIAYLLGSIPSALWIGKTLHGIDVREHGSRNAGATNTFRVLGRKAGVIVLLMDVSKGVLAVLLPSIMVTSHFTVEESVYMQLICAVCVVIGHVFPLFAGFKGGKGVATSLGVIIGIHPLAAVICLALFLVVFLISGFVSLGAMAAATCFPLLLIGYFKVSSPWLSLFSILLSLVVIAAHHKNIGRLIRGEENKMNLFKKRV